MAETIDLFVPLGDPSSRSRRGSSGRSGGRAAAPASCASCGARSTRARSDRSAIACASRSRARARRSRRRRRRSPPRALARRPAAAARGRRRLGAGRDLGGAAPGRGGRLGDHPRAGQAGAAAPPRSGADHARRAGAALELLLRRGRRRHLLRRQALHALARIAPGVAAVLADLVRFGAPAEIEVDARPHVGSNRLPKVLDALREHLAGLGVDDRFETEATGLRVEAGRVRAVRLSTAARSRPTSWCSRSGTRRAPSTAGRPRRASRSSARRSRSACASSTRSRSSIRSSTAPPPAIPSCRPRSTS